MSVVPPVVPDPTADFTMGVAIADAGEEAAQAKLQEEADVKAWLKKIDDARKFDENARKRYVIDRRFARNAPSGFDVSLPIAASYIDILVSFLYSRNPDVDCEPSDATTPPPESELKKIAAQQVMSDPATAGIIGQAGQAAKEQATQAQIAQVATAVLPGLLNGGAAPTPPAPAPAGDPAVQGGAAPPPSNPDQAAQAAMQQAHNDLISAKVKELMEPYRQRLSDAKQFGETLEAIISYMWTAGKLKAAALPEVKSSTTVGIGWLKSTWQERLGNDPVIEQQIADLRANIEDEQYTARCIASGEYQNLDELKAKHAQQIAGLQANVEKLVARGMVFDFVSAEDIQVSTDVPNLASYLDAPWISHRTFMSMEKAGAMFPDLTEEDLKKATQYYQKKAPNPDEPQPIVDPNNATGISADEADAYNIGTKGANIDQARGNVRIEEAWCRDTNMIVTLVDGVTKYARAPYPPDPGTTRFYPFFQMAPLQVDGLRHPQSLISRTQPLLEQMNRIYSNAAEWRRRSIPKTIFNASGMSATEAKKIEAGGTQELCGIKPTNPEQDMRTLVVPLAYAQFDEALYDDGSTRAQLETAWGIQEALSSSIQTAKTAHEAEIQQKGTEARTSFQRDSLDEQMRDLANYCAEVASQKLTAEDAKEIAGPFAFWPKLTIDSLNQLIKVNIRAGSSGKPDTAAQQQAWATTMPVLQSMVVQIGQLRGSSPDQIADCLEALVVETINRTGDKLDPDRFLPGPPDSQTPMAAPQALPGPTLTPIQDGPNIIPAGATLQ